MATTRPRATNADRHVGARIRERRIQLGLTQQQMADLMGVTYQQEHKYERGINRITVGRLYTASQALGVPVAWFFDGLDDGAAAPAPARRGLLDLAREAARLSDQQIAALRAVMASMVPAEEA